MLRGALPDLRVESTSPSLGRSSHACFPWRLAGTHRGDMGTLLPATNRFVTLHGLHYVELSDGLVRRARGFFDLYDAATQLGLLPERGGLGEAAMLLLRGFGLRRKAWRGSSLAGRKCAMPRRRAIPRRQARPPSPRISASWPPVNGSLGSPSWTPVSATGVTTGALERSPPAEPDPPEEPPSSCCWAATARGLDWPAPEARAEAPEPLPACERSALAGAEEPELPPAPDPLVAGGGAGRGAGACRAGAEGAGRWGAARGAGAAGAVGAGTCTGTRGAFGTAGACGRVGATFSIASPTPWPAAGPDTTSATTMPATPPRTSFPRSINPAPLGIRHLTLGRGFPAPGISMPVPTDLTPLFASFPGTYSTATVPFMPGWTVHTYSTVPGVSNACSKVSPFAISPGSPDLNSAPGPPVLVTS